MDKIEKALRRLREKERRLLKQILQQLAARNYKGLNIQKLRGRENVFRVRKSNLRIIYHLKNGNISILAMERRSEKTYKKF